MKSGTIILWYCCFCSGLFCYLGSFLLPYQLLDYFVYFSGKMPHGFGLDFIEYVNCFCLEVSFKNTNCPSLWVGVGSFNLLMSTLISFFRELLKFSFVEFHHPLLVLFLHVFVLFVWIYCELVFPWYIFYCVCYWYRQRLLI